MLARCLPTVFSLMNSCLATSRLDAPAAMHSAVLASGEITLCHLSAASVPQLARRGVSRADVCLSAGGPHVDVGACRDPVNAVTDAAPPEAPPPEEAPPPPGA